MIWPFKRRQSPPSEPCPVCKQPMTIAGAIGPYCATTDCPVLDDALLWNADGTYRGVPSMEPWDAPPDAVVIVV